MEHRPDWDTYGLALARAVAVRADCTRRRVGAVLLDKDRRVASTGYNGSPPGGPSCLAGQCPRGRHALGGSSFGHAWCICQREWPCALAVEADSSYADCVALHAEANCLLRASWSDMAGATLYVTDAPCHECSRLISGTPIARVVVAEH